MSFSACLVRLQAEGKIDRERAARFAEVYQHLEGRYRAQYGAASGDVLAAEDTVKALDWDAQLRRRQAALQVESQRTAYADMETYDEGSGQRDGAAIRSMMARDTSGRAPYANVEGLTELLDYAAHAKLETFLEKFRRNLLGQVRNKAELDDVIRARHGQRVASADAQAMSDAYGEVAEGSRQQFNLLGGDIGHDATWGVPHMHSARRVRMVPYEMWRDGAVAPGAAPAPGSIMAEIDPARMKDPLTGQPFTAHGLEDALRSVYETIRSDGLSGGSAAEVGGAKKLANRRSDARFLQFKDGDAWLRYNAQYGETDPFTAMMSHVHGMNRDIALLQRFGPNPDNTVKWLNRQLAARSAASPDPSVHALNAPKAEIYKNERLWNVVSGNASIPVVGGALRMRVGRTIQGARNVLVAAKLGKAVFSALGDVATDEGARRFNGLPQLVPFMSMVQELNPLNAADRKLAAQLELGMRDAAMSHMGLNRFLGLAHGPEVTRTLADSALRITGLNAITDARQRLFGRAFLAKIALERGNPMDALEPAFGQALRRYGIDEPMWDTIRASPVHRERGGEWASGKLVRQVDPQAAERMMDMVLSETAVAVQMTTARGRALTNFGRPLTFQGEAGASLFQFKGFSASMALTQAARIDGLTSFKLGAIYAARLAIQLTLLGAGSIQLRQLSYSQDLRPMNSWEFWVDALVQGGGLPIFGDVIGSFQREGASGGLQNLIGGPLVGAAAELGMATVGEGFKAMKGEQTHFARRLIDLGRRNTPLTNTWYLSAAFNRMIFDQIQYLTDPDSAGSYARSAGRAAKQGAPYYWKPGDMLPERAPALGTAVRTEPEGAEQ